MDLKEETPPQALLFCPHHSDNFKVPKNWTLVDERTPTKVIHESSAREIIERANQKRLSAKRAKELCYLRPKRENPYRELIAELPEVQRNYDEYVRSLDENTASRQAQGADDYSFVPEPLSYVDDFVNPTDLPRSFDSDVYRGDQLITGAKADTLTDLERDTVNRRLVEFFEGVAASAPPVSELTNDGEFDSENYAVDEDGQVRLAEVIYLHDLPSKPQPPSA